MRYPCIVVFRILADATVVLHLAFVFFALLGGLLVLRWPGVAWVHLPAAAWGAWVEGCSCNRPGFGCIGCEADAGTTALAHPI